MVGTIWMAVPPEVHSALLSDGPGPGPMVAAATAWNSLSVEYAAAAEELVHLVASVGSALWEGRGAQSYGAAHQPYALWLLEVSAKSAATAGRHELAAAAYAQAVAAMPTLPDLAANHATHAALVATNFFGINTIPIALNEADYVRMWIQAATTMAIYEASATAASASTPDTLPAPRIVSTAAPAASLDPGRALLNVIQPILLDLGFDPLIRNPLVSNVLTTFIADVLENFGIYWEPATGMLNGAGYESYADATQPMWYVARGLELIGDSMQMTQNPAQALQYFVALSVFDWPTHIAQLGTALTQSPLLLAVAGSTLMAPAAGAVGGMAGLAGLAGSAHPAAAPAPVHTSPTNPPVAAMSSPSVAVAAAPVTAAGAGVAASTGSAGVAPPPNPPANGAGLPAPYAVGPPGIDFDSGMAAGLRTQARKQAPEPDSATAAAPSSAVSRRKARVRHRKRTAQRHDGDEFMTMDVEVEPDWERLDRDEYATASHHGAGRLGLAGTTTREAVTDATGLTTLADDEFGGGPVLPMVPSTWR